jgi:hypothetical protein
MRSSAVKAAFACAAGVAAAAGFCRVAPEMSLIPSRIVIHFTPGTDNACCAKRTTPLLLSPRSRFPEMPALTTPMRFVAAFACKRVARIAGHIRFVSGVD